MKTFNKILAFGAVALGALAMSATATAAPTSLTCADDSSILVPDDITKDRLVALSEVEYTGSPTSLSCGPAGRTSGSDGMPEGKYFTSPTFTFLEKINDIGNPTEAGTFITSISGLGGTEGAISLAAGITDAVLVFKYGAGGTTPDWISFKLDNMTFANWSVQPAGVDQALSHVTLYGTFTTTVPEPATVALLGLGLLGLGYGARRRKVA